VRLALPINKKARGVYNIKKILLTLPDEYFLTDYSIDWAVIGTLSRVSFIKRFETSKSLPSNPLVCLLL
jgi:hypothetical protein